MMSLFNLVQTLHKNKMFVNTLIVNTDFQIQMFLSKLISNHFIIKEANPVCQNAIHKSSEEGNLKRYAKKLVRQ